LGSVMELRNGSHVTVGLVSACFNRYDPIRVALWIRWEWGFWMVLGIGTDLIEIKRIEESLARFGGRFMKRVFTPGEIAYCQGKKKNSSESFAARFAAKEAGAKALGTGISRGVSWKEIEVRRQPGHRPTLHWSGRAAERAAEMGIVRTELSLTHSRSMAMAVVVVEGA
jgi:holo-[acyl-carrier protein] synthase